MKKFLSLALLVALSLTSVSAQQASTLFFLENSPHRHIINPAFQPVSKGYFTLPALGFTSLYLGNNSVTYSDLFYKRDGQFITALRDRKSQDRLFNTLKPMIIGNVNLSTSLVGFGFRHRKNGYVYIDINQRMDMSMSAPRDIYRLPIYGMPDLTQVNHFDFSGLGGWAQVYTEIGGGYSYRLNDKWTIGGKVKLLLGASYSHMNMYDFHLEASADAWRTYGDGSMEMSLPFDMGKLPSVLSYATLSGYTWEEILETFKTLSLVQPSGYGAALDFGFEYSPLPNLHLSLSLMDLGFITWTKSGTYDMSLNGINEGDNDLYYGDISTEDYLKDVLNTLEGVLNQIQALNYHNKVFTKMINGRINAGLNASFVRNILGVGFLSQTQWRFGRISEEVTIGANVKPCNWFNFALSYSLVNNAKFSDIGAGISIMPYDGINLTLALDYIPTAFANVTDDMGFYLPYKSKGVNAAIGLSIVWGTNKKDKDKDGVENRFDLHPNTPRGVKVDRRGCPLDADGDGVPDYLDKCPGTPVAAYGLTDSVGCPIDTDGDGVPDYLDECNNTKPEARGHVDAKGCDLDSDGDGVPDYLDKCPNTPAGARGYVDSLGCEIDSDHDGVPDWRDECFTKPGVPVDSLGCDLDSDGDGVPDYLDECPTVPGNKKNKGCPEVKREVRNLLRKAMQGIEFETGKAAIKAKSFPLLDQIAKTFIENAHFFIEVQGHSDNVGSQRGNMRLSDDRARAVRTYLINKGVPAERIVAQGYGPTMPIADNKTKEGRQKNRRVEFNIQFEEIQMVTIMDRVAPDSVAHIDTVGVVIPTHNTLTK